jgi:trigger factor
MKKEIKKLEGSKIEATVTLEGQAWSDAQQKAFEQLAKNLEVKGFRKGNAPEKLAREQISQADIFDKAINIVLQGMYDEVLKDETIKPFARPKVSVTKISDTELETKFEIICAPEVKLGEYKGLHAEKKEAKVSEKEVEAELKKMQQQNAELVLVDREAILGDTLNLDFEGFIDDKPFEGGKAENYSLELGSHSFVPGFEEQLVGLKANDEKSIKVTFPKEYVENLAGKEATFKIKVHEVKEKKLAELNDELASDLALPEVKTIADLKKHVHDDLLAKAQAKVDQDYYEAIVKQIRDGAKIDVAKEVIDDEVEAMEENMKQQVKQNGLEFDQYLKITGQKEEDVKAKLRIDADVNIRSVLVLEKIAEIEKITVKEEEIDQEMQKIADQYKMELAKVKEILNPNRDRFVSDIRGRKIHDFLIANNK